VLLALGRQLYRVRSNLFIRCEACLGPDLAIHSTKFKCNNMYTWVSHKISRKAFSKILFLFYTGLSIKNPVTVWTKCIDTTGDYMEKLCYCTANNFHLFYDSISEYFLSHLCILEMVEVASMNESYFKLDTCRMDRFNFVWPTSTVFTSASMTTPCHVHINCYAVFWRATSTSGSPISCMVTEHCGQVVSTTSLVVMSVQRPNVLSWTCCVFPQLLLQASTSN
jgi:hypothetical protein